ncbi:MAG: flavin reductase family protein [Candidatus Bipolaricaulota bacterium]|nr:flavin reductase family protein [Candidatus Bipolaricaulota bacterium]MCX7844706.1 flavin reductase family protein [Candidatus Bipolaricaulota bacterium]MDW8152419.1 flavin reductase family protein [Candidatus Bipolaricaulota bacterium]
MSALDQRFRRIEPWVGFAEVQKQLHREGAFLVSVDPKGRPNAMTIGWALLGTAWRLPVLLVLVRPSRYTHGCLLHSGAFTVNVPFGTMGKELEFCGEKSGRDVDKFRELGLRWEPGREVPIPVLTDCDLIYECRVVARAPLPPDGLLSAEVRGRFYPQGNLHTLFFGEVVAAWRARK